MTISVCTLARGRARHLENMVLGLRRSARPPRELVVAVMQSDRYQLPEASFPVRQVVLGNQPNGELCLARGRNAAAAEASGELLVFLDVDCVPHPSLIDDYASAADRRQGVFMGEVGYLANGAADDGVDFDRFEEVAVRHPERPEPPQREVEPSRDAEAFWSLNFAIWAKDFASIGGFDERFTGYGGEDCDFARTLVANKMPLWWVQGAKAYHQFHPHHVPPVHHLDSVLANARSYQEKWGESGMEQWLRAFTLMGLIKREEDGWRKLREPNEADFALTRQQEQQPYASAAQVLQWLEGRAVRRLEPSPNGRNGKSAVA
jgi:GT2 family glycosyltransferase